MSDIRVFDLFGGAGGFALGAHQLGLETQSLDIYQDAIATQVAAGMNARYMDLRFSYPVMLAFSGYRHVHASPPCTTFSIAGLRQGVEATEFLQYAIVEILAGRPVDISRIDEQTRLVLRPAYIIKATMPESVTMEQVPKVYPLWKAYAHGLAKLGYSSWTTLVRTETFGVPQARMRALMGASLIRHVVPPRPTFTEFDAAYPEIVEPGLMPWVSVTEATGMVGMLGFPRRYDGRGTAITLQGKEYRLRDLRETSMPSFALTEKARSWTLINKEGRRQIDISEAAVLQGFPANYPFQGSRKSQFRQCANAVPPPIAKMLLRSVLP